MDAPFPLSPAHNPFENPNHATENSHDAQYVSNIKHNTFANRIIL